MKPEDFEKGLKNKHYKKFEREELIEEYELLLAREHQIERVGLLLSALILIIWSRYFRP